MNVAQIELLMGPPINTGIKTNQLSNNKTALWVGATLLFGVLAYGCYHLLKKERESTEPSR
jgi:hypothetical protein